MRQSHPELYVLLLMGIEPKTLQKKGYSKATIYSYNRKLPEIRKKLNELI
ncbi:MAG: hypothetical protein NT129_00745 [Candidatus Aenigmarchaeota archaeon]|nr:hypothetical protein [Candidatus Aenigmarchaeota archaeon]